MSWEHKTDSCAVYRPEPKGELWIPGPRHIQIWQHWEQLVVRCDGEVRQVVTLH